MTPTEAIDRLRPIRWEAIPTSGPNGIIAIVRDTIAQVDNATPKHPPLGSVSEGTLRPEDLIPAYLDVLATYAAETHDRIRDEYSAVLAIIEEDDDDLGDDPTGYEQAGYLMERLEDALSEIAGPYSYFGSSEGDGASIGFWPDIDQLEEDARHEEDVLKITDAPPAYLMSVSDHGNVTLYAVEVREIWSVV